MSINHNEKLRPCCLRKGMGNRAGRHVDMWTNTDVHLYCMNIQIWALDCMQTELLWARTCILVCADITDYHRLNCLNNRNVLLIVLEAGKSNQGQGIGIQCLVRTFLWCPHKTGSFQLFRQEEICVNLLSVTTTKHLKREIFMWALSLTFWSILIRHRCSRAKVRLCPSPKVCSPKTC